MKMPHAHSGSAASSGGDDLGSTDEVKVFKDEGDGEDEKRSSENLLEEKSSLIDWTESEEKSGEPYSGKLSVKSDLSPVFGKFEPHPAASFNMGYLMAPYPYPNGGAHPLPVSMAGKMGLPAGGSLSLFCPGGDLGQPPPAHMGIPPPYQLDSKLAAGLARTPMYPFPGGTYPYPMLSPEMSQVAASWHTPSMYPISSAASGFRSPYPTSLPIPSSSLSSELYRFSPTLGGGLGLGLGPALVPPPSSKADVDSYQSRYARSLEKGSSSSASDKPAESTASNNSKEQNKKPHIKKPLNAFMLYMKEMRAKVVAECTLKESAAINQILGRRWHSLSREEQAKYYEKARQERQLHMQLYPGWSARDNYGYGSKKKKRKKDRSPAELGGIGGVREGWVTTTLLYTRFTPSPHAPAPHLDWRLLALTRSLVENIALHRLWSRGTFVILMSTSISVFESLVLLGGDGNMTNAIFERNPLKRLDKIFHLLMNLNFIS